MYSPLIPLSLNIIELGNLYYEKKYKWYLAYIPLNIIDFSNWEPSRYNHNIKLISETKCVKPIILGDFDDSIKKYTLSDGNHRCFCSNELGYTHIPAIVHISIKDHSFQIIQVL
jgi:hypothetical protein